MAVLVVGVTIVTAMRTMQDRQCQQCKAQFGLAVESEVACVAIIIPVLAELILVSTLTTIIFAVEHDCYRTFISVLIFSN